jgi:hypothetical protein
MFVREVLNRHGCSYSLAPGADGETRFDIWFPASSGQATRQTVHFENDA